MRGVRRARARSPANRRNSLGGVHYNEPWPGAAEMGTKLVGTLPYQSDDPMHAEIVVVAHETPVPEQVQQFPASNLTDDQKGEFSVLSDSGELGGIIVATLNDGTLCVLDVRLQYNPPS